MTRIACALAFAALAVAPLDGQDLSGSYVYPTEQGVVRLELEHAGSQVTGVMHGLDGSVNRLSGNYDGGRATGSIQVQSGSGWFAAMSRSDGLTLVVAALDPVTGEPDVANGWQLDFTRAGGAASSSAVAGGKGAQTAGAAGAPRPAPQAAQPPQAAQSTPLVREWMGHLSGKKVTYIDSYSSGGSGGYSDRWEAFLCSDGSFHFRSSSNMSADVGGVYGNSNSSDSFSGSWRVIEQNGQAILQYQRAEQAGTNQGEWVALGYQNGETYFDGSRVYVTADNQMCR